MTPAQLEKLCEDVESMGTDRLILTIPEPKSGIRGRRVKTPFGLCEIANVNESRVVFWATVKQIRNYIKKVKEQA